MFLAAVLLIAAGCSTASPASAPAGTSSSAPSSALVTLGPTGPIPHTATPGGTNEPATAAPTASLAPTQAATAAPTPAPTPVPTLVPTPSPIPAPTRTLRPGETPKPTPLNIESYLTARLDVMNLGEQSIAVEVALSDGSGGDPTTVATATLQSLDSIDQLVFAGDYRLTFRRPSGSTKPVVCTVTLKDGETISFWPTDELVAITKAGTPPKAPGDLIVGSSPLCKEAA